ncbi:putative short-chain dehydrogenase [Peziza echinospora]|nr:putative short-chain dehydrogenase [Peziza echinospora]
MAPLLYQLGIQPFQTLPVPPPNQFYNKTALVTGSNVGLGFEAAKHILIRGARLVILCVRDLQKGEAAKQALLKVPGINTPETIQVWHLDQSSFASVRAFSEKVIQEVETIDFLILNAGIVAYKHELTEDGWEKTLQVNDLSTCLLALKLLPKMIRKSLSGPGTEQHIPRLVIVASGVHITSNFHERHAENILQRLNSKENFEAKLTAGQQYPTSKLINMYMTERIAPLIPEHPVTKLPAVIISSVDPGFCYSELARDGLPFPFGLLRWLIGRSTEVGSRNLVAAALIGPEGHGKYIASCVITKPYNLAIGEEGRKAGDRVYAEIIDVLKGVDPSIVPFVDQKKF